MVYAMFVASLWKEIIMLSLYSLVNFYYYIIPHIKKILTKKLSKLSKNNNENIQLEVIS